jgi:hypothetical protein
MAAQHDGRPDTGLDRDREAVQLVIDALGAGLQVDGISPELRRSLLLSRADLAAHWGVARLTVHAIRRPGG